MGNEISMKAYGITLLLLANLASFASDAQSEIEGYEDKFAAINKERRGLDASDLNKLSDPFLKTKSVTYDSEGNSTASLFELQALFNNKAKINGKWSLLDKEGKVIIPPKYDDISDIDKETKSVFYVVKDEKAGLVNMQGEEITPISYDAISEGEKGVFILTQGNFRGVLFKQKILVPPIYESINGYATKIGLYKNYKLW